MTTNERPAHFTARCEGTNEACKAANARGVTGHFIPPYHPNRKTIVLPTYHYWDEQAALGAYKRAQRTAPTVTCDDDLYRFRAEGIAFKLPVGWIDPSRR